MGQLIDAFGRQITYLRVSVTDHCNYRCFYCRDEADASGSLRKDQLSNDEMVQVVRLFTELGVKKIRLTGGEPLIRKGIADLATQLGALPHIEDFSMSTNAHLLADHAQTLYQAGLHRLNISLDSVDAKRFTDITRGGDLQKVLAGITAAFKQGFSPIKVNMVVMRGINDGEIETMLDYAMAHDLQLRYIETMPIGEAGIEAFQQHYSAKDILARVQAHVGADLVPVQPQQIDGPARIYRLKDKQASVGVISATSQHFCDTCNRVRLTSTGDLVLCLGQENSVSLRDALRGGASDNALKRLILEAIDNKPERHEFTDELHSANQQMVTLGG